MFDNNARNVRREKKQMKAKTDMGQRHHIYVLVRWQQQAEWRRTGINLAETSGQRCPGENLLREERERERRRERDKEIKREREIERDKERYI